MSKKKFYTYKRAGKRKELYDFYTAKYKRVFINKFEISGVENDNALRYFFNEIYFTGKIWISNIKHTEEVFFSPFAPVKFDPYYYPLEVNLTPKLWANYIPRNIQKVNEDGVICYITQDASSPFQNIEPIIDKIVDAEMVLDNQLILHKLAWFCFVNPEDKDRMKEVITNLLSDDVALFGAVEDYQALKPFNANISYIVDKLRDYIKDLEAEILTILGVNNTPHEKKEHLIVDEVASNNQLIEENADNYLQALKESFDRLYDTLGIRLTVKLKGVETLEEEIEEGDKDDTQDNI